MNALCFSWGSAWLAASVVAWSQNYGIAGPGGGAGTIGVAGGWSGGPTVARVNVAPGGGAGGFAAGGAGGAWMGNIGQVGGGLHGVTRPTFMGEPNAVAAQFFSLGGLSGLPPATVSVGGRFASGGVYLGQSRRATASPLAVAPGRLNGAGGYGLGPQPGAYPVLAAARNLPRR